MTRAQHRQPDVGERRRERRLGVDVAVVHHAGQHQAGQYVEHHRDRQRVQDRLGHVPLGVLRLLRGGAHRVVAEHGEEHRRGARERAAEPEREERDVVARLDVEGADDDHQQDDRDLEVDQPRLEARRAAHPAVEDEGDEQAQQHGEQVDLVGARRHVAGLGTGSAEHPLRQRQPEETDQLAEVAGDADGDDGDDRGVLQQQVPADEPARELPQHHVAVGVGRARARDQAGELRVGERGRGTRDAGDQERDEDRGPGLLVRDRPGQGEDPGADDAADPDGRELPQAERALQAVAALGLDVVDRLAAQERRAQPRLGHAASPA